MESLKKVISLNQASKMSGYTQDYLGYLIRQGEMKGVKKGRVWFTTEEDVIDYIFKKKIRSEKLAVREFFSPTRSRKIIIAAGFIFVLLFVLWATLINKKSNTEVNVQSTLSNEQESGDIFNSINY